MNHGSGPYSMHKLTSLVKVSRLISYLLWFESGLYTNFRSYFIILCAFLYEWVAESETFDRHDFNLDVATVFYMNLYQKNLCLLYWSS